MPNIRAGALLVLWLWGLWAFPQEPAQRAPVYVTASFLDKNNLFIESLSKDEVQVIENGQLRRIEFMARDEIPVVYGLIFERALFSELQADDRFRHGGVSGSTSAREIAYHLVDKYLGRQAMWVGTYDQGLEVALDVSFDGSKVKETIQQFRGPRQPPQSSLYGALLSAVTKMNDRPEKRRVLLVFLDILDIDSGGKIKSLKSLLSGSNVEVFFLSFASALGSTRSALHPQMSQAGLKELAMATAGEALFAAYYREHAEDLTQKIYNQIRTFYTLGFQAESTGEKPGSLVVKCTRPGSKARHHPAVPALP